MIAFSPASGQGKQLNKLDQRFIDLMYRIGLEDVPSGFDSFTPEAAVSAAEKLVQEQLDAYNAGDIDAFLVPYDEEVEIYNFPDQLAMKGHAQMRETYARLFSNVPELHCELVNRIVMNNTVIDQEHVTGLPNGETVDAIAVYKIDSGKIKQVYFIR